MLFSIFLLISFVKISFAYVSQISHPFTIFPGDNAVQRVKIGGGNVICEAHYVTIDNIALLGKTAEDLILKQLEGNCTSIRTSRNGYQVCIGSGVQRGVIAYNNPDVKYSTNLGSYSAAASISLGSSQIFVGGGRCDSSELLYESIVAYFCGPVFAIVAVDDSSSCDFKFQVSHPYLCNFPEYFDTHTESHKKLLGGSEGRDTDVINSLPESIRHKMGSSSKLLRGIQDFSRDQLTEDYENHNDIGLNERDKIGSGGKSIGLDDGSRHGSHWVGVSVSEQEDVRTWLLTVNPAFSSNEISPNTWTCSLSSTDDLRRGAVVTTNGKTSELRFVQLTLRIFAPDASKSVLRVAKAQNSDRHSVPVNVEYTEMTDDGWFVAKVVIDADEMLWDSKNEVLDISSVTLVFQLL